MHSLLQALHCVTLTVFLASGEAVSLCTPDQWEGVEVGRTAVVPRGGQATSFGMRIDISRDYKSRRETWNETVYVSDGSRLNITVFNDYNKMSQVIAYPDRQSCRINQLASPMKRLCNDSTDLFHITTWTVGGSVADYYMTREGNVTIHLSVFRNTFVPMFAIMDGIDERGNPTMTAVQFGNITVGIKDPNVFRLPSYCSP